MPDCFQDASDVFNTAMQQMGIGPMAKLSEMKGKLDTCVTCEYLGMPSDKLLTPKPHANGSFSVPAILDGCVGKDGAYFLETRHVEAEVANKKHVFFMDNITEFEHLKLLTRDIWDLEIQSVLNGEPPNMSC
jgi:hypothetical protein